MRWLCECGRGSRTLKPLRIHPRTRSVIAISVCVVVPVYVAPIKGIYVPFTCSSAHSSVIHDDERRLLYLRIVCRIHYNFKSTPRGIEMKSHFHLWSCHPSLHFIDVVIPWVSSSMSFRPFLVSNSGHSPILCSQKISISQNTRKCRRALIYNPGIPPHPDQSHYLGTPAASLQAT